MHSRVLYTVQDMQADGFAPTEELGVVDTRPSSNPAAAAQRQAQAQAYAGQLKSQVADLYTHDARVGADMSKATANEGKIQFVDHSFKQAPSGDPSQNAYDKLKDQIREHNLRYPSVTAETAPGYNREAETLNRQKGELEAKLGKSETAPARMSRLVPDWAHPAPEQLHTPAPAQPRSPMDLSTPHAHDLGTDPAIGSRFRLDEAETGLRVEQERGVDLIRNPHPGADWIDVATGEKYDGVGNFPAQYFDSQWPNLQTKIIDHLAEAEYVPIDVSQFTAPQRAVVRAFVDGLKDPRVFIVGDK
jgi:hypothetical protein